MAYLEHPVTSIEPYVMFVNAFWGGIDIQVPANAVTLQFDTLLGVSAASPGTYSSAKGDCGTVALCVYLPTPAIDCGDASSNCPPGCGPAGPISHPICQPIEPETCYVAAAPKDCLGNPQAGAGTWTLELTSVGPFNDASSDQIAVVHGTLTATLVEQPAACPTTATLSLSF